MTPRGEPWLLIERPPRPRTDRTGRGCGAFAVVLTAALFTAALAAAAVALHRRPPAAVTLTVPAPATAARTTARAEEAADDPAAALRRDDADALRFLRAGEPAAAARALLRPATRYAGRRPDACTAGESEVLAAVYTRLVAAFYDDLDADARRAYLAASHAHALRAGVPPRAVPDWLGRHARETRAAAAAGRSVRSTETVKP